MLCQFAFKNFKSYKEETWFDFQAETLPEFEDTLIVPEKGSKLLPVSVFYGPNGGGKSNLLQAISCLINMVVSPIRKLEKNRIPIIIQHSVNCIPFLLDEQSAKEPTEFLIYFRVGENEYQYFLSVLHDEIVAESLNRRKLSGKKTAKIFERDHGEITLGASIRGKRINTDINAKMPFLSFLSINYNLPVITEVQEWFESCLIRNYANPKIESGIFLSEDHGLEKQVVGLLNDMDIDIQGYRFDEEEKTFYTQRQNYDQTFELPFADESAGTKKLIVALPIILTALKEGRLAIIDELDAKLHPKLLKYIIFLFKNPEINKYGAQLLFTSHDMTTMKNTVFRRDEIWFAAADENHESKIYSLAEIRKEDNERVKNTEAYHKQYLEGRYGADPYLQNMLMGGGWQ